MMSSNALSLFLLYHEQNVVCNRNICSIQDLMDSEDLAGTKFKCVFADFPDLSLPTKSAMAEDIQVTYVHASAGNKSLRETLNAFALAGYLEPSMVVSINVECIFSITGKKIHLLVTEVLLCATNFNLTQ